MIDYNKIFSQDAFNSIEKERLQLFKDFIKKLEGKNINETFLDIIAFFNSFPKGKQLTELEKQAIIKAIINSLSKEEQKKVISILELMENIT